MKTKLYVNVGDDICKTCLAVVKQTKFRDRSKWNIYLGEEERFFSGHRFFFNLEWILHNF